MNPVLIIGGAHIDRKGAMETDYIIGASIPGTIEEVVGGGAFNVAANLSRLGSEVTFISPRADDTNSIKVANAIKPLSISDNPVICGGSTPSYTALIDRHGELVAALADMKLYDNLSSETFLTCQHQTRIRGIHKHNCNRYAPLHVCQVCVNAVGSC